MWDGGAGWGGATELRSLRGGETGGTAVDAVQALPAPRLLQPPLPAPEPARGVWVLHAGSLILFTLHSIHFHFCTVTHSPYTFIFCILKRKKKRNSRISDILLINSKQHLAGYPQPGWRFGINSAGPSVPVGVACPGAAAIASRGGRSSGSAPQAPPCDAGWCRRFPVRRRLFVCTCLISPP